MKRNSTLGFWASKKFVPVLATLLALLWGANAQAADYYWIGGSGNWSDLAHWATTSGGVSHPIIVPSPSDNVIFDANSGFTAGNNVVTTNTNIYCRNMTWNNAPANPIFNESTGHDFFIYQSLTLQSSLTFNARIYFTGSLPGTITSNGAWIRGAIEIDKNGSSITMLDNMVVQLFSYDAAMAVAGTIILNAGTFNMNGFTAHANGFYSNNNNTRHLNMTNSTLWLKSNAFSGLNSYCYSFPYPNTYETYSFVYVGNGKTVAAANSWIKQSGGCNSLNISGGTQLTFNNFYRDDTYYSAQSTISNSIFNVMETSSASSHMINSSAGAKVDSMLFNSNGVDWTHNSQNGFNGNNTIIGTLIFYAQGATPLYNNYIAGNSNTIGYAEFKKDGNISGTGNTFNTLVFTPGYIYRFAPGTNNTITGNWFASGNPCYLTEIVRTATSGTATITKNGSPVNLDYVRVNGIVAAGTAAPFSAGEHSIDLGGNTNWNFQPYNPGAPIFGLGPDQTVCPSAYPIVLNTNGFLGSPSTQYLWSDGGTDNSMPVTGPGTYWVSVDYGRSCIYTDSIIITDRFEVSFSGHVPVCDPAVNSGSVTATATGVSGPYTYSWNTVPVQNTATATGLAAGTYVVTVVDSLGCSYQASTTILGPSTGIAFDVSIPPGGIFPDCDSSSIGSGALLASVVGGSGPYTVTWNTVPPQTTEAIYNLNPGNYLITATDANGCQDTASASVIAQYGLFAGTVDVTNPTGCDTTGDAVVEIVGGIYPFTYIWSHDSLEVDSIANSIIYGNHAVDVSDKNGCFLHLPFDVIGEDITPPSFTGCPANIVVSNTTGTCGALVSWVPPVASDSCGIQSVVSSHNPGDTFPVGVTLVTYTATDILGNVHTCSFTVTVNDTQKPHFITCPSDIVITATAGNCSATAAWTPVLATDNCPGTVSVLGDFVSGTSFPVGTTTVTYIATDAAGNKDTCRFKVIIKSHPSNFTISNCPNNQFVYTEYGTCTTSVTLGNPVVNNLCGNYFLVPGPYSPGGTYSFSRGDNLVRFRYTNTADTITCAFTITVYDPYGPTTNVCPPSLNLPADTCGGRRVSWTLPTFTDNCGLDTMTSSHLPGTLFPVGATLVTHTAVDETGNQSSCQFYVTITDNVPVIANCPANRNVAADTCGGRRVTWTPPTVTDNCLTSFTSNYQPGHLFPVGNTVVTYTAVSANGGQSTCSFTVTVTNPVPVIAGCPSNRLFTADTCGGRRVTWVPPTATDNCLVSFTSNHQPGELFPVGTTVVTYTATDDNGAQTTCSFNVIINAANPQPGVTCPSNQVFNLDSVTCSVVATWVPPVFTHPCGIDTVTYNYSPGDTFSPGIHTVTYTATSNDGFIATCSFTITVNAFLPPITVNNCPPVNPTYNFPWIGVQVDTSLSCGEAVAAWPVPTFTTSYCSSPVDTVQFSGPQLGDTLSLGLYYVSYVAYDSLGNPLADCSFYFEVLDTLSRVEVVNCPLATITIQVPPSMCNEAVANFTEPQFTSYGCFAPVDTVISNIYPGDTLALGSNPVTYTAYDSLGNWLAECSFTIEVQDTVSGFVVTCPPTNYNSQWGSQVWFLQMDTALCGAVANWPMPTFVATGCMLPVDTIYANVLPGDTLYSNQTITYEAYDSLGNLLGSCNFLAVLEIPFTIAIDWPEDTLFVVNPITCMATVNWDAPVTQRVCGQETFWYIQNYSANWWQNGANPYLNNSGQGLPPGIYTIDYYAYNNIGGEEFYTLTITVADGSAPSFGTTCPSDTVLIDSQYNTCFGVAAWPIPQAVSGVCSSGVPVGTTSNHNPGDILPIGSTTITYTATNAAGLSSTCSFVATVVDVQAPVFLSCPGNIVLDAAVGACSANATWSVPQAFDNCPGITVTASHMPNTAFPIGTTTVTYTATDASGKADTCSFTVTVNGNDALLVSGCPANITIPAAVNCQVPVMWTPPTAAHVGPCGGGAITTVASHTPGDVFPIGTTPVTYTFTDTLGNTAQCIFTVTVTDSQGPVFTTCPTNAVLVADAGVCGATYTWTVPMAIDSCGAILSVTASHTPGTVFPIGNTTILYTATDSAGNETTCSFTVTVSDTEAPVANNCPANISAPVAYNQCFALVSWPAPTFTDNCGMASVTASHVPGTLFPVGTTMVTYVGIDLHGNSDTCSFTITVTENQPPVFITCPSDITVTSAAGSCGARANWPTPFAFDNCAGTTVTASHTSGSMFPVGTTTVTYIATDATGNTDTCSFDVTVLDAEVPVIVGCPANITVGNTPGQCSATVNWTVPAVTDNCSGATLTGSHTPGTVFPLGTTVVTYTAVDATGNTATCSFTVTVNDTELPMVVGCPSSITQAADAGTCSAAVIWTAPSITDNCSGMTIVASHNSGDVFPVGITVVSYTATDAAGHTVICQFNVTVLDTVAPVISGCPTDIAVNLPYGSCGAIVSWVEPTATDNCSDADITSSHVNGGLFPAGVTTVIYTVTDSTGNTDTCSFTITVTDTQAPVIFNCPPSITVTATPGNCTAEATWGPPMAVDNCSLQSLTADYSPGDTFPIGTTLVTYTATDTAGNSSTCMFAVTVLDSEAPAISGCPSNITVPATAGACEAPATWTAPTATNSCGGTVTATSTHNPDDVFPVGTTTVIYTFSDSLGNDTTCTFTVTVTDNELPQITGCPANITIPADAGTCGALVSWTAPVATDNCSGSSLTSNHTPGTLFPIGTTQVTYTATDSSGNVTTCSFTVTVTDSEAPVFAGCPTDITVAAMYNQCSAIVSWTAPTATDNCSGITVTSNYSPGANFPIGNTVVTYVVTDAAGNTDSCSFTVTVTDTQAPVFMSCPSNVTVQASATVCGANVSWSVPNAFDNCAGTTVSASHTPGSLFPIGTTTVTYVATDASGNSDTCSFTVTVTDATAPVITGCPVNISLTTAAGTCAAPATWTAPTATDNCSGFTFTANYANGATFPVGTTVVTYTATDSSGNVSTCSFTVTVTDATAPVITGCPANITVAAAAGVCTAPATWTAPTATDNCSGVSLTSNHNSGDTFPVGTTTVMYMATDSSGNSVTCSFTVTVTDNTAPVAVACPTNLTLTAGFNQCFALANWTAPSFTDNCTGGVTVTASHTSGSLFPIGATVVTYTATDAAGNVSICTFTVTVTENQAPIFFFCPSDITVAATAATCGANVSWPVPQAFDNCGGTQVIASHTPGTLFPVGTTAVSYTATDVAGNQTVCTFNVTVTDALAPVITGCPANVVLTATPGICGATATWTAPTATDACGTPTLVANHNSGDQFPVGVTPVTYTFTDAAGNAATCTFTVTVNDTEEPAISNCPANLTVPATAGQCGANVTWTAPTAVDNCTSSFTFTSDHASGDFFPVGTTVVTYTASDSSGNEATCVFLVTVTDTELPILLNCPTDVTVQAANNCEATATWTAPTATDNCGGTVALLPSHLPGSHFPVGITTVTYTAMDGSGNIATCSFNVTVADTVAPLTITCPGDIQACDHFPYWVEPTFTDNCNTVLGITTDHYPATYFATGVTTVTYTATDAGGNTATCSFSVSVSEVVLTPVANATCGAQSGTATVTVEGGSTPYSFAWSNGSSDSLQANVQGGQLTVTVTDANGCVETLAVQIPFGDALKLDTSNVDEPACGLDNGSITVYAQGGNGNVQYTWNTGATQPYIANLAPGKYTVSAIDDNGCSDTLAVSLDCMFRIPQLVTPNADNHNDTWVIPGIEKYPEAVVEIFNRWGNRIFYASPYSNDWAGLSAAKATLGKRELPAGTYFYVIKLTPDSEALSGYLELQY